MSNCFFPPPGGQCIVNPSAPVSCAPSANAIDPGQSSVSVEGQPALGSGCKFLCAKGGLITVSSPGQAKAKHEEAAGGPSLDKEALSLAADLTPVIGSFKSAGEVFTGKDLITDQETSRWLAALGIIPFGKVFSKGGKAIKAVGKAFKSVFKSKKSIRAAEAAKKAAENKEVAKKIANGHAYDKHILGQPYGRGPNKQVHREFPGAMRTRKQFQEHIEKVLNDPKTPSKQLKGDRIAHWDNEYGAVIIKNSKSKDMGTMFQPKNGKAYFDGL